MSSSWGLYLERCIPDALPRVPLKQKSGATIECRIHMCFRTGFLPQFPCSFSETHKLHEMRRGVEPPTRSPQTMPGSGGAGVRGARGRELSSL